MAAKIFKMGMRVKMTRGGIKKYGPQSGGGKGTVNCNCAPYNVVWDNGGSYNYNPDEIAEIGMADKLSLTEKMALVFKKEPEKSFIKAGIMNTDETLTEEGREVFEAYLLRKHGDDFKKEVVDPILAEEKSE